MKTDQKPSMLFDSDDVIETDDQLQVRYWSMRWGITIQQLIIAALKADDDKASTVYYSAVMLGFVKG